VTIEVSSTDRRDGKALALFARWQEWQRGKTKQGRSFFAIPGSQPNLYHMADCRECSCPDFQRAGNLCKHVRACRLWLAAFKAGAVSPKQRPATPNVIDDAGIGDETVSLTPEGAAAMIEQDAATPTLATYERLYPTCRVEGCTNDPEPRELDCYRHMLVDAF
jgi:hypothetical protein